MKDFNNSTVVLFTTLVGALIIVLVTTYFSTFVTYADFNKFKMEYQRTTVELCTKLEIIIKNQDQMKKKLDML